MNSSELKSRNSFRISRSNSNTSVSSSVSAPLSEKSIHPFSVLHRLNENDRLTKDQGLITPKYRSITSHRRVRDKSYYKGLIHLKNVEINNEIKKLQREIQLLSIERSAYLPYKKKAETKAIELQSLQRTLTDYNITCDMVNSDTQLKEVKDEVQLLKLENEIVNAEVVKLFDVTKQQEKIIHELETDLSQENYVSEILTATMNPQMREKYKKLKRTDDKLQFERIKQEEQMKSLNEERMNLENKCTGSKYLREALIFLKNLRQKENQRDELLSEKTFTSKSEEEEYLQKCKTECNDLLKGMTLESRNLEIKIKEILDKLKNTGPEIPVFYKERLEKYSKLKKKEAVVDEYLTKYDDKHLALLTEQQILRSEVIKLLTDISCKLKHFNQSMNVDRPFGNNEDDKNMIKAKSEYLNLMTELNKINSLENKFLGELKLLKNEIAIKKKDMPKLSRIDDVTEELENKEKELLAKLNEIKKQKYAWKLILEDLQKRHHSLEEKLNKNETYIMLSNLEKRWHSLEEENFSIKSFLSIEKSQKNYLLLKDKVRKIYSELNKML